MTKAFFEATTNALGSELWRLNGVDGSVLLWADINPGAPGSFPGNDSGLDNPFNNALWFDAFRPATGFELYKLGADGSVTSGRTSTRARTARSQASAMATSPRSTTPCGSTP
jgi:ELWxxDGT repeat protein